MRGPYAIWLREQRGQKGEPGFISQVDLAERVGVDKTFVSQLENSTKTPEHATRQRFHHVFGTSDEDLTAAGVPLPGQAGSSIATTADGTVEQDRIALHQIIDELADEKVTDVLRIVRGLHSGLWL